MRDFQYWDSLLKNEYLFDFCGDRQGILWLKLKSIIRVDLVKGFIEYANLNISTNKQIEIFKSLYQILSQDIENSHKLLDNYIHTIGKKQMAEIDIEKLVSELYKLRFFQWGGDYQNSLDKYLISRYIKTNDPSFDTLMSKFEAEINPTVKDYVLSSWFNYWSSVLIERIFFTHPLVLPTIGKIKNVDFFINDLPFDLKVTYMPAEYLKQKRKERGLPAELSFLKNAAKSQNICFDTNAKPSDIIYEITEKLKDKDDKISNDILNTLQKETTEIVNDTQNHPKTLSKWLYENQGEMRFGSENRIYVVLIDTSDIHNSWKLKRNLDLLQPAIHSYLDNFKHINTADLQICFDYKGKPHSFTTLTDVIFITK